MMQKFNNEVAVITGAGSGIGQALAVSLARHGCHVALADVNATGLAVTQALLKGAAVQASLHQVDVARREALEQLAEAVIAAHGRASLLFNNAGVACAGSAQGTSEEDFHWLMNINFWGVVNGCQVFLPLLRQQPRAHIINLSSVFGLIAMPTQAAYNASKFAVRGYSEALQQELRGSSVGVSVVCPGGVRTAIAANSRVDAALSKELGGTEGLVKRFNSLREPHRNRPPKPYWTACAEARNVSWSVPMPGRFTGLFACSRDPMIGVIAPDADAGDKRAEMRLWRRLTPRVSSHHPGLCKAGIMAVSSWRLVWDAEVQTGTASVLYPGLPGNWSPRRHNGHAIIVRRCELLPPGAPWRRFRPVRRTATSALQPPSRLAG